MIVQTWESFFVFFQAEDGIRDYKVTGVQTCALPIWIGTVHAHLLCVVVRRVLPNRGTHSVAPRSRDPPSIAETFVAINSTSGGRSQVRATVARLPSVTNYLKPGLGAGRSGRLPRVHDWRHFISIGPP